MIEKNIPLPETKEIGFGLEEKIPDLLLMKVGDSTLVSQRTANHIELALWGIKRGQQHKMVDIDEGEDKGKARIWRTR